MLIIVTDTKKKFGTRITVYELRGATEAQAFDAFQMVSEMYEDHRDRFNVTLQHFGIEHLEAWVAENVDPSGWWERIRGKVDCEIVTLARE